MSTVVKGGLFVVLEGIDRAGKTTQAARLVASLNETHGYNVRAMRFPVYSTPVGHVLQAYLQSKTMLDVRAAHLMFCANRWENAADIREALALGAIVVCDRYSASGIAYSVAKGAPLDWCVDVETGLPEPDLVLYLGIDPGETACRPGYGHGDRHEVLELQHKISQAYALLRNHTWHGVTASRTADEVAASIFDIVLAEIVKRKHDDDVAAAARAQ